MLSQTCSSKISGCCFPINKPCFNLKKHDLDLWEKQRFANICVLKTKNTKLKTCQVIGVTTWMLEYKSMKNLGFTAFGAENNKRWDLIFLHVSSRNLAKHSRFPKHIGIPMLRNIKLVKNTVFLYIHRTYKKPKRAKRAPAGMFDPLPLKNISFGGNTSFACLSPFGFIFPFFFQSRNNSCEMQKEIVRGGKYKKEIENQGGRGVRTSK